MGCQNKINYYIDTIFGRYWVCAKCSLEHPIPADMRKTSTSDYIMSEADKTCECEYISHFTHTINAAKSE